MLLCDFHIHTKHSDGSVGLRETVDLFGQAGFDVIAITDHVVNGDSSIGKLTNRFGYSIDESNFDAYMFDINNEADRAMNKYEMLVIPGIEISKNYLSSDKSAHMLLLDIKEFIPAHLECEEIFCNAREQDALVIACHPHYMTEFPVQDTLYLWNHREKYAKYIDAWEIANRDDVFNVISLKKYPYIANSDFHKPRHLYSWKTLLNCEKNVESVKECIRHNKGVAITIFRQ